MLFLNLKLNVDLIFVKLKVKILTCPLPSARGSENNLPPHALPLKIFNLKHVAKEIALPLTGGKKSWSPHTRVKKTLPPKNLRPSWTFILFNNRGGPGRDMGARKNAF